MNDRHLEHGQEAQCKFLKPSRNATAFLEPADALLDNRALPIALSVEVLVLVFLIGFSWDHWTDAVSMKPIPDANNAIRFVASEAFRTLARPANWLRNTDAIQNRFNLGRFMLLSRGYFDGEGHSCAVSNQVEFTAKSAF